MSALLLTPLSHAAGSAGVASATVVDPMSVSAGELQRRLGNKERSARGTGTISTNVIGVAYAVEVSEIPSANRARSMHTAELSITVAYE